MNKSTLRLSLLLVTVMSSLALTAQSRYYNRVKNQNSIFATVNFNPDSPFGAKIGLTNIVESLGLYLGYSTRDFSSASKELYSSDSRKYQQSVIEVTDDINSYMLIFGVNKKIYRNLFLLGGFGFGKYAKIVDVKTQYNTSTIAINERISGESAAHTSEGMAMELGVMYKWRNFAVSAGLNSISFSRFNYQIGLGYFFNRNKSSDRYRNHYRSRSWYLSSL